MALTEHFGFKVRGIESVCYVAGEGRPLLLLHGTGPGASAVTTWHAVVTEVAKRFRVYAPDLIGFGRSGPTEGALDPDLLLDQAMAVIDQMPGDAVSVFGHSLSGYTALRLPSRCDRVSSILTTGTLGEGFEISPSTELGWSLPNNGAELRRVMDTLVFDQSIVSEEFIDRRMQLLSMPECPSSGFLGQQAA